MRILFDLQAIQGHARHRGLGRYSLALAQAMSQNPDVTSLDVLLNAGTEPESVMRARQDITAAMPAAKVHLFDAPWPWRSGRPLDIDAHARAEHVRALAVRELDPEVVVIGSLFELPFTSVLSVPDRGAQFTVVVAYDLLPFTDPTCAYPDDWQPFFARRFEALKSADLLLAISDYTASELRRCLGTECPPVSTIWGAAGDFGTRALGEALDLSVRRGVVCAGGGGGRKNEHSTLAAYARLPGDLRGEHPLTIQGHRERSESEALLGLARELGLSEGEYQLLDRRLDEGHLEDVFARARVVTMPSLAEGLGLPVLEAWSLGTPAVASGTTSLGEVVGDPRWTFDPNDADEQAQVLELLLTDEVAWRECLQHGRTRLGDFTWPRTAQLAVDAISELQRSAAALATPAPRPPLVLIAPRGANTKLASCDGPVTLAELLVANYEVRASTPDRFPDDLDPSTRLLFVLDDSPGSGAILAMRQIAGAVLVAASATLDLPLEVSGGIGGLDQAQQAYLEHGAAGLRGHLGLGREVYRAGLGVIALSEQIAHDLESGRNPLHPASMFSPRADSDQPSIGRAIADFIEGAHRRRALPADERESLVRHGDLGCVARNRASRTGGTIFHDVTAPLKVPSRSGIQRVSAALEANLIPLASHRLMPVALEGGNLCSELSLLPEFGLVAADRLPVDSSRRGVHAREGDVLLITELYDNPEDWTPVLGDWRARGGIYVQVLYDLLPIQFEDFFVGARPWFERWARMVACHADLVVCDSRSISEEFTEWLATNPVERLDGREVPEVTFMRLGFDLSHSVAFPEALRRRPRGRRNVLVVGTIEPRKGVEVVMDAAEELWRRGEDIHVTFVGNRGWALPSTLERLEALSSSSRPLSWVQGADDEQLRLAYLDADLLVMASRGEGFGLPIVEALAHGVPVVARDLPVFRELLGDDGTYFRLDGQLPDAILERLHSEAPIAYVPDRLVTWRETAQDLLSAIERHLAGRV